MTRGPAAVIAVAVAVAATSLGIIASRLSAPASSTTFMPAPGPEAAAQRWPGWTPIHSLSARCPAAVAADPAKLMPPYEWVPCRNGAPSCQEFAISWSGPYGVGAKVSHDAAGNPRWLMFMHVIDGTAQTTYEQDLYDIATGQPLGAWRATKSLPRRDCYFWALLGRSTVTLDGELSDGLYLASGDPHTMTTNPVFQRYAAPVSGIQEELASDSMFAFDLEPQGVIARTNIGSGTLLQQKTDVHLLLDAIEGSDAYAISEHGSNGWGQVYVLDANGSLALLRSNPAAHVATPASDGVRLYWTETYGSIDVRAPQARTELWSAPYTADPALLARTAGEFAVIAGSTLPLKAIAFGGLMAVIFSSGSVYVGRVSDGKVVQVDPGPSRRFAVPLAVTASELWSLESNAPGGPVSSLTRVSLHDL